MIEIPTKNKSHFSGDRGLEENHSLQKSYYNKPSERPNIETSVDKWGFVINSNALNQDKQEKRDKDEDTRSRNR